jgi:cation diffusion facilitator family transporter
MLQAAQPHSHVFLGEGHEHAERRTWWVIWLCGAMMALEIIGGSLVGSIALVADGLHMSTHAGALLLAALAYSYARRHADDARFSFGTGKLGDLAGFSSAIVLAMIAVLIGYEAIQRLLAPVPIAFAEAIPIACLGLGVNIASAWLLSGGDHHHHHHHGGAHAAHHDETQHISAEDSLLTLGIFEDHHPPVFRLHAESGVLPAPATVQLETIRPDGSRASFTLSEQSGYLQSRETIPEPHAFTVRLRLGDATHQLQFAEHEHQHGATGRDNNMRAAVVHVMADAAVSVLVIMGLVLARVFGWLWMDPLAGIVGACVIASWSYGLLRDTGAILLDMNPDRALAEELRRTVEQEGDRLNDLHLWRVGPGHLAAIVAVSGEHGRDVEFYRRKLARFGALSHLTIEIG